MNVWKLIPDDAILVSVIQTKMTKTEVVFTVPADDDEDTEEDTDG